MLFIQFPEQLQNWTVILAVLFLFSAVVLLSFVGFVQLNRHLLKTGAHPAFLGFVHEAIVLAYKSSDAVFDAVEDRLRGAQKKELADAIYDLLPGYIHIGVLNVKIDWKKYVPKDKFSEYVQLEYDKLVEKFGVVRETILREMMEEMTGE